MRISPLLGSMVKLPEASVIAVGPVVAGVGVRGRDGTDKGARCQVLIHIIAGKSDVDRRLVDIVDIQRYRLRLVVSPPASVAAMVTV